MSKATSSEVAFPPPRPKERGHEARRARDNPAQPEKKRRRGRRGQAPQRQEKREARRIRRKSEGARGNTKMQLYCLQKDCYAMKKQVQELSATVVAVQEALSSGLHMLTIKLLCRCEGEADITGGEEWSCTMCKKSHKRCYLCAGDCFPGCSKETKQLRGR